MTDLYTWLKALHVAAALVFVAGVAGAAVFGTAAQPHDAATARTFHAWDRMVTTPAMLLVWALGVTLALQGGWFRSGWLSAKLVFGVVLSGLHGVQSARLRRLAGGAAAAPLSLAAPLVLACATAIAVLVVVKPFCSARPRAR